MGYFTNYEIDESVVTEFQIKDNHLYQFPHRTLTLQDEGESLHSSLRYYPTTCCLITAIQFLYCYQWFYFTRRKKRQRYSVSYDLLVTRKRFHRVWSALLSHTPHEQDVVAQSDQRSQTTGQNDRIPSALASENIWNIFRQQHSLPTHVNSSTHNDQSISNHSILTNQVGHITSETLELFLTNRLRYQNLMAFINMHVLSGHFSGLPLLLYNSHILWSLRALERAMTEEYNDSWYYARMLIALAILSLGLELWIIYILLHARVKRRPGLSLEEEDTEASEPSTRILTPALRLKLQQRPIATCSIISIALLTVWIDQEASDHFPIPILPGMSPPLILRNHSDISCAITIIMLTFLAGGVGNPATALPWMRIVCAIFAGVLWSGFFQFLGQVRWGWGYILLLFLTSILAAHSDPDFRFRVLLHRCIQAVPWNSDGQYIFPNNRYNSNIFGSMNDESMALVSSEERTSVSANSTTTISEDASEEDLAVGDTMTDDSAGESGLQLQLLLPHTMRSRRNRWNPL